MSARPKNALFDNLLMLGFIQTVQKETSHRLNNESSLIDHSWVNDMNKFLQMSNYETVSKHDLIVTMGN